MIINTLRLSFDRKCRSSVSYSMECDVKVCGGALRAIMRDAKANAIGKLRIVKRL